MPAPVIEQIAANVLTTLAGVTTVAGYSVTLAPERRKKAGNTPAHLKCVIFQGAPITDQLTTGAPAGLIYRRTPFVLQVWVIDSEDSSTAIDEKINYVIADIEKALMADPHRNALAHDTILGEPEIFDEGENGYSGVLIPFEVQHGHLFSDPTTAR